MPTKFAKGDEVRVHATKLDGKGERAELNMLWSERWAHDNKGEWCYGKISFVFKKKSWQPQKYRIKYHEGIVMESLEADIELAPDEIDDEDGSSIERVEREQREELSLDDREEEEDSRHPLDTAGEEGVYAEDGNVELDSESDKDGEDDETVVVGGVLYNIGAKSKRRRVTVAGGTETDIQMG
jgi:hypothetical protein